VNSVFHEGVEVKRTIIIGFAGLILAGAVAEAKVYRWVDEDGKVVFSQTPPPESIQGEEIKVDAPPPATAPEKENAETDVGKKTDKTGKNARGNPALDDELRQKYCETGKKNLDLLENSAPDMGFVTEDNKLLKFSPEEKALKIREAQAVIKAYCD
jgi:hypothetical protein